MARSNALPHNDYITTVTDALTAAGLEPADWWTSDAETRGVACFLDAVITLEPPGWQPGLLLMWEWHTGREDGGPERGPQWTFARLNVDGSNQYPTDLPVYGFAAPAAVADAARMVIAREIRPGSEHNYGQWQGWTGGIIGAPWEHADDLEAACAAWDADEAPGA